MTTIPDRQRTETDPLRASPHPDRAVRWDRTVVGLLLAVVGVGWLLDTVGVSVPWHLAPAAAVVVVGMVLLVSLLGGRGRGGVVALGAALLIAALGVGVGADHFIGPVGDRTITGAAGWSSATTIPAGTIPAGTIPAGTISAGTIVVDLTREPLPATGRLAVTVGAGRVVLHLPADRPIDVRAAVVVGTVTVDDVAVQEGVDLDWTDPATAAAPLTVVIDVGAGDVEVFRAAS